jgi:hypothetical protein
VLVEHAQALVVRHVAQSAVALLIAPRQQLLSWPHAQRGDPKPTGATQSTSSSAT